MKVAAFAARSLRREFRHGELAMLAAALVLAVAALTAVGTLATRVESAIVASAADLLGADLMVNARAAPSPQWIDEAHALGLETAQVVEFPTVVFAGDHSQFCEIRASNAAFPLRGQLLVRDAAGVEAARPPPAVGEVYADHRALVALDAVIGAQLQIGDRQLRIAGELVEMPDGGDLIQFAPRVLMALDDARSAGLLGVGSRARYRLLIAGDAAAVRRYADRIKPELPASAELTTVADTQQNLRSAFDRGGSFLHLAALLAALLSGIAIALAAQRFARRKTDEVALLRCLGASRNEIALALGLELALLALPACLLGLLLGLGLQQAAFAFARDLLPGAVPALPLVPGLMACAIGLAVVFGFALPPLLRLRDVAPIRVFGRAAPTRVKRVDALYLLPVVVGVALIWLMSDSSRIAATLTASMAGVAVVALVLGLILLRGVAALAQRLPGTLRFGIANLARRRGLTLIQIGALALSLTALNVLAVVGPSLLEGWRADLPADTPNWFVMNVQPDQRDALQQRLHALGASNLSQLPLAVGKLTTIDGQTPRPDDYSDRRAANWINGEVRVSWSEALPPANTVLEGQWFDADTHTPAISVDRMWADTLHLKLGDTLGLRIGDRDINAKVTSIRGVAWDSFRVNFFLMIDPASGADLAHSYLASFHLPATAATQLSALSRDFPNVSLIDINAILDRVRDIIAQVSAAVTWVLGFSLLAGILVLLAALAATADARRFESALLRALGAHRRQLTVAALAEFAVLGLLAGIVAAAGAAVTGLALARYVFKLDSYVPPALPLLGLAIGAALLVCAAGLVGTLRIVRAPPLALLRRG